MANLLTWWFNFSLHWFSFWKFNFNEWKLIKRISFSDAVTAAKNHRTSTFPTVGNVIWWHSFTCASFRSMHTAQHIPHTFMWLGIFDHTHFHLTIHSIDSIAFICIIPAQSSLLQIIIIPYMHSYNWVCYTKIVLVKCSPEIFICFDNKLIFSLYKWCSLHGHWPNISIHINILEIETEMNEYCWFWKLSHRVHSIRCDNPNLSSHNVSFGCV